MSHQQLCWISRRSHPWLCSILRMKSTHYVLLLWKSKSTRYVLLLWKSKIDHTAIPLSPAIAKLVSTLKCQTDLNHSYVPNSNGPVRNKRMLWQSRHSYCIFKQVIARHFLQMQRRGCAFLGTAHLEKVCCTSCTTVDVHCLSAIHPLAYRPCSYSL